MDSYSCAYVQVSLNGGKDDLSMGNAEICYDGPSDNDGFAIGMGVGGGVFALFVIIVVILVVVKTLRRRRAYSPLNTSAVIVYQNPVASSSTTQMVNGQHGGAAGYGTINP